MNPTASAYINNTFSTVEDAVKPVKVAVIGAHQDDIPIMYAPAGGETRPLMGLTLTNGAGAPSDRGPYKDFSEAEIARTRKYEQIAEAAVGDYNAQFQLAYTSPSVGGRGDPNGPMRDDLTREVYKILMMSDKLDEVYFHNSFDKHQSHSAVTRAVIEAIRMMPKEKRPNKLIGCEVWRGLDWLPDGSPTKVGIDVSEHIGTMKRGLRQHESQTLGSKGYVEATEGRYLAGATYGNSHASDKMTAVSTAIDMTEMITDDMMTMETFVERHAEEFKQILIGRAKMFEPRAVANDGKDFETPEVIKSDKLFDVVLPKTIVDIRSKFDWQNDDLFESYKDLVRAIAKSSDRKAGEDPAKANMALSEASKAFSDKLGEGQASVQTVRDITKIVRTTIAAVKGQGLGI